MRHEARVSLVRRSGADAVYLGQNLWLEVHKRHRGFAHLFGRDHITGHEVQNCVERSLPRLASFGLCFLRLVERSSHRLCQACQMLGMALEAGRDRKTKATHGC